MSGIRDLAGNPIGCPIMDANTVAATVAEDRIALYERISKTITGQEDPRTAQLVKMYLDLWTHRLMLARSGKP